MCGDERKKIQQNKCTHLNAVKIATGAPVFGIKIPVSKKKLSRNRTRNKLINDEFHYGRRRRGGISILEVKLVNRGSSGEKEEKKGR